MEYFVASSLVWPTFLVGVPSFLFMLALLAAVNCFRNLRELKRRRLAANLSPEQWLKIAAELRDETVAKTKG
jgi:hypothetical protein